MVFRRLKRVGSILSRSEFDSFLYIWYHTAWTQNGLNSPVYRTYVYFSMKRNVEKNISAHMGRACANSTGGSKVIVMSNVVLHSRFGGNRH